MFYKIQPKQIELHAFSSPSGDFSINQGEDSVELNLSRYLTGDFYLTGSAKINNRPVLLHSDQSGSHYFGNNTIGGGDNSIFGTGNSLINAHYSSIYGNGNTVLMSRDVVILESGHSNSVLAGSAISFDSGIYGSAVLKDFSDFEILNVDTSNKLYLYYLSGINVYGDLNIVDSDLYVSGAIYSQSGELVTNLYVSGASGYLSQQIINTGALLNSGLVNGLIATGSLLASGINTTGSGLSYRLDASGQYFETKHTIIDQNTGYLFSAVNFNSTNTGSLYIDNSLGITWTSGKVNQVGRVDVFSTGIGTGSAFTGNAVSGYLKFNGQNAAYWANGLMTLATGNDYNFITGNGVNGQYLFTGASGPTGITWQNGLITTTGTVSGRSPYDIPLGWEEMTMNFTDADGFLRTRTFLVKSE